MSERTSSPEERLLRLIRGKPAAAQPASIALAKATTPPRRARPARAIPSWSTILPVCNVVLGILLVGFIGVIVWRLTQPVHLPAMGAATQPLALPPQPAPPPALDPAPFQQRQLFQLPVGGEPSSTGPSTANAQQAQAALATLTLMGIVDGQPPQAIIADSATQKSYFVTVGETFGAGIQVKKIGDGRVTLSYQGVEADLHL